MREQLFAFLFFFLLLLCAIAGAAAWRIQRKRRLMTQLLERKLRDLEQSMELLDRQYTEMGQRLEQTRKLRHDLRHHVAMLRIYAQRGDFQALEDYFQGFSALRLDAPMHYCTNAVADALARHYLGAAQAEGIAVDAVIEVGEETGIAVPDLCVVLGNCLENAVEAARKAEGEGRFIRIRVMETQGWLTIVQENGCPPGTLRSTGGGYLSSKEEGRSGIGLMSVLSVAEQYGGTAAYQMEDGRFRTSVILFKRDESV